MTQLHTLTNREREVVTLLLQGRSNKLIALALGISDRTVEFHLRNIYAKSQVSSRIELILKLGYVTGNLEKEKPGSSTVVSLGESAKNRDAPYPQMDRRASFRETVSMIGKELQMKNLFNTKHVPAGIITALFTGLLWIALLRRFEHMSLNEIQPWILPLVVRLVMVGSFVGFIGKRNGSTLQKVAISTWIGTGLSPIAILPLMGFVVLPLGKFVEWLGLIDRSTMTSEVATMLAVTGMLAIWLIVGTAIGAMLLHVTIKRPGQAGRLYGPGRGTA